MQSKLAQDAERAMIEAIRLMSPEERLNAFLAHCELMMELFQAGRQVRAASEQPSS